MRHLRDAGGGLDEGGGRGAAACRDRAHGAIQLYHDVTAFQMIASTVITSMQMMVRRPMRFMAWWPISERNFSRSSTLGSQPAEHDMIEARALAATISAAPDALLRFCEAEAEMLIRAHLGVVTALIDALVEKGS
jgi:hypothetical protein